MKSKKKNYNFFFIILIAVLFILSIAILFYSILKFNKINSKIRKVNTYYLSILTFYFFPYISVYVFPRHCVAMYILGFVYILLFFIYSETSNKVKNIFYNKNFK